jgi:hypothetical protein
MYNTYYTWNIKVNDTPLAFIAILF